MSKFEFFEFSPSIQKEWDTFILSSRYGSVHQVSDWADFQKTIPGRETVLGFGVRDINTHEIVATTWCVKMETGFLGKYWWYSARGPVFDPQQNLEAGRVLMDYVKSTLRSKGGVFWRFDPYFTGLDFEFLHIHSFSATQQYQPTDTLEIDLRLSDADILKGMKRKGRYNIKVARKHDLRVVIKSRGQFTEKDVDDFWRLTTETTSRDGFSGHQKSYYRQFLKHLQQYAVLFFIETPDGHRIATAISTFCGSKAIYYFGASTSDSQYRNMMAPYLLQWEMMQYGKQQGCQTYDFLGIAPENQPHHPYAGISEFKWKFGGSRKTYASGREVVFSSFWYWVYRMGKKIK